MKLAWLFLGLGVRLQLFGASLSFTELAALLFGPFFLIVDRKELKKEGVSTLINLAILLVIGCVIACIANETYIVAVIRGLAVTCILLFSIPFSARLIRRDFEGFKYFLIGAAISGVLSTFMFKQSVEVSMYGEHAEDIMNGTIYWIDRIKPFVMLPGQLFYLQMPLCLSIALPLGFAAYALLTNASGRSTALCSIAFALICALCGNKARTIRRIGKHFYVVIVMSVLAVILLHNAYRFAALRGWLGSQACDKYMIQTKGKKGIGALLLGGRMESFVGLLACKDKPIIGWGPWAIDEHGYVQDFLGKYGDVEDYQKYMESLARRNGALMRLSAHSVIVGCWLWYGIFGLIFWLYVLYVFVRYLKEDCHAVPQMFYWIAGSIQFYVWAIFFSPLANRFEYMLVAVACLMVRAVRKGVVRLPLQMNAEIMESEMR